MMTPRFHPACVLKNAAFFSR